MFQVSSFKFQENKGFGLLGVIIAIFITSIGLVSILALASMSLKSSTSGKMRLIASGLAQEGIEIVRDIRRSNADWIDWEWYGANGAIAASSSQSYRVQYDSTSLTTPYSGAYLKMDANGLYQYDSGPDTLFKREITLKKISYREVKVVAEVKWQIKGKWHYLTIEDRLWNWK
jgi:hypothetical protein